MTMTYTDKEVYENRMKWVEFLMRPETKKGRYNLDNGNGERCCLGHGCFVLGFVPELLEDGSGGFSYEGFFKIPPKSFADMVGLDTRSGMSVGGSRNMGFESSIGHTYVFETLADLNDHSSATPQDIGEYLKSVIMGGAGTPFKKLEIKLDVE